MRSCLMLALAALLLLPAVSPAAIYKWVDPNGTITFRDTPPPSGVEATVVDPAPSFNGASAVPSPAASGHKPQVTAAPARASRNFPKVELYTTSWCGYCREAKKFLRANGVPFIEYDIEKDANAARRKDALGGRGGVPFAVIGEARIHGYAPAAYAKALGITP